MNPSFILAEFPLEYQDIMLDLLLTHEQELLNICTTLQCSAPSSPAESKLKPYIAVALLAIVLGLSLGGMIGVLLLPTSSLIGTYFQNQNSSFPGRSTIFQKVKAFSILRQPAFHTLAGIFQEQYEQAIGDKVRNAMKNHFESSGQDMTIVEEAFLGIASPAKIFPNLSIKERGKLLPFLNFRLYARAQRNSSIAEMIGLLHHPNYQQGQLTFQTAAKFGFLGKVPGIQKCYQAFRKVEAVLSQWSPELDKTLIQHEILQFTALSVDTTNIPVDKRDQTGSIGTGSRGSFFGHKGSLCSGSNCVPFSQVVESGRVADSTVFSATFQPVVKLAIQEGKEIWVTTTDAGYCDSAIVQEIEQAQAIAVGDLNPKNSKLLKQLKDKAHELAKLSRLAFYSLLPKERTAWRKEVETISENNGGSTPLSLKKIGLTGILHNYANRARYRGLSYPQQQKEKRLRQELMKIRRAIKFHGTLAEQIVGCSTLAHKTIEWFLAYAVRGQNEGINGILKKRGDLIGDGQHQSWLFEKGVISNRLETDIISIKVTGLIYSLILGTSKHCMRALHNWRNIVEVL